MTLYGRGYCHLCSDMEAAVERLRGEFDFALAKVDVDADPELETRFGDRVPVLLDGEEGELCHYFLDEPKVREYLGALG